MASPAIPSIQRENWPSKQGFGVADVPELNKLLVTEDLAFAFSSL
jgi:hypothetical protein